MTGDLVVPDWKHHRVVSIKYPAENIFDKDDSLNTLLSQVESLTADSIGSFNQLVSNGDYREGNGWGIVMASFYYAKAGRFNDSTYGAYYCADSTKTAISEWAHHTAKIWRDFGYTQEISITVRDYVGTFKAPLRDLRDNAAVHHPDSYEYSQATAKLLKLEGANGIIYKSVRGAGLCAAIFRPPATSPISQSGLYTIYWNGQKFHSYAKITALESID